MVKCKDCKHMKYSDFQDDYVCRVTASNSVVANLTDDTPCPSFEMRRYCDTCELKEIKTQSYPIKHGVILYSTPKNMCKFYDKIEDVLNVDCKEWRQKK